MNKKIVAVIITGVILGVVGTCGIISARGETTTSEANIPSETTATEIVIVADTPTIIDSTPDAIVTVEKIGPGGDVTITIEQPKSAEEIEEELRWKQREAEYPAATYIWKYFTSHGFSEEVTAGLLGNMMTEVGEWVGNIATMNLDVYNNGKTYYGICQWKKRGYSEVVGTSLEGQCDFLLNTIEAEYEDFGRGYTYETFLQIKDPAEAALSFAKSYERCESSSYSRRQRCAVIAYEYFTK